MLSSVNPIDFSFALFFAFLGAGLAFVRDENIPPRSIADRIYSQFASIALDGLICLNLLVRFGIDVGFVAAWAFFLGVGLEMGLTLFWKYLRSANSFPVFVRRAFRAYNMVVKDEESPEKEKDNDNE